MMKYPLLVRTILERCRQLFPKKEIVSRDFSGIFRYTYGDFTSACAAWPMYWKNWE